MPSFADSLYAKCSPEVTRVLRSTPDVDARLTELVERGRRAHPSLVIPDGAWTAHLAAHLAAHLSTAATTESFAEVLSAMRAEDVHLVLACLEGSPAAHTLLKSKLEGVSAQALIGINLGSISAQEILQDVLTKLLVGVGGPGKIASYSGRGPLEGWLRVTISRAALSLVRRSDPEAPRRHDDDALVNVAAHDDPELANLRARCGPMLERTIRDVVGALDPSEKTILRLHFVDALTIDDLAVVYRVHRATVARRIARAKNLVFEAVRARVMAALGLDESAFQSLMGGILSAVDVTLRNALDAAPAPDDDR